VETRSILCRAHVDAIREVIAVWKAAKLQTVLDVEDMIQECVSTHDLIQDWRQRAWKQLFTDPRTMPVEQTGQNLKAVLCRFVELMPQVRSAIHAACANPCMEKLATIDELLASGQKMLADLESRWPFIDFEMVAQSLAEIERGEVISAEEAFRELLGDQ